MSLLDTDLVFMTAVHPHVAASQRPTLDPAWAPLRSHGRRADRSRPVAGARSWTDVLRLAVLGPRATGEGGGRHTAPAATFACGTLTTVRAQQELRAS